MFQNLSDLQYFFAKELLNCLRAIHKRLFSQFFFCLASYQRLMGFFLNFFFVLFFRCYFMSKLLQNIQQKYIISMKSGAFLKDIRNIKKGNGVPISMTTKNISSSKQLKKTRSSEQLNLHRFIDNKNQTIKSIDHKLQVHQSEIEKNNGIISELTNNFTHLRGQLVKEKEKSEGEEKKNKSLKEEIERTNKLLKNKNFKIEDLNKRLSQFQKQLQTLRLLPSKVQELVKANANLRKMVAHFEDVANEKKFHIQEKQRQNEQLRDKLKEQVNVWEEREQFKNLALEKEEEISKLKDHLTASESEKMNMFMEKQKRQKEYKRLKWAENQNQANLTEKEELINELRKYVKDSSTKQSNLQKEKKELQRKVKEKTELQELTGMEVDNLRSKVDELNTNLRTKICQQKQTNRKFLTQEQTILDLKRKISQYQINIAPLKDTSHKIQLLRKKSKTLQAMYNSIIPQIQCPFGHQLVNPITVIPCGHNYCLSCKRGYTKECTQCNGKLKIEAVYRNELMDDIIGIVGGIKQVVEILK